MKSAEATARRWALAPAGRLVWLAAAVALCALQAPWSPELARLALVFGAALAGLAVWDGLRRRIGGEAGAQLPIAEVLGDGAAGAERLRLTLGRQGALRLRLRHCAGARAALMAESALTAAAVGLSDETPCFARRAEADPQIWSSPIEGRERGQHTGLICGFERRTALGLWRERTWQPLRCTVNVYPDLSAGRKALLESSVYRAMTASEAVPLTGQGREFERLRDYQAGDVYSDLSWKATARRGHPVTRLFQWEQSQQIYFIVDHGRLSRVRGPDGRARLEAAIETALVGASAASELGDQFGLIAVSSGVTRWLGASNGRAHFNAMREALLDLQPEARTPDFDALFSAIKVRLRRRCCLMYLGDLTERGLSERFAQSAALVRGTHVVLGATSAAFKADAVGAERQAIEFERQRMAARLRELGLAGIEYRIFGPRQFLVGTIEIYLESKRSQRL